MIKNILFVCTGNTCRSSMAEYLFRYLAREMGRSEEFIVRSAGVAAIAHDPASDHAIEVLEAKGIVEIGNHQATPVNDELVINADLILTMTQGHKTALLQRYPNIEGKIYTVKEYTLRPEEKISGVSLDIQDPFGGTFEIYQGCASELEEYLRRLLTKHLNR